MLSPFLAFRYSVVFYFEKAPQPRYVPSLPIAVASFRNWREVASLFLHQISAEPEMERLPIAGAVNLGLMLQEEPVQELAANPSPV